MSFQEMVAEIPKLTFAERVTLLASLTESFRAEMPARERRPDSVRRLRSLLKPDFELPPDWDWKKAKEEYLAEKYL